MWIECYRGKRLYPKLQRNEQGDAGMSRKSKSNADLEFCTIKCKLSRILRDGKKSLLHQTLQREVQRAHDYTSWEASSSGLSASWKENSHRCVTPLPSCAFSRFPPGLPVESRARQHNLWRGWRDSGLKSLTLSIQTGWTQWEGVVSNRWLQRKWSPAPSPMPLLISSPGASDCAPYWVWTKLGLLPAWTMPSEVGGT